MVKRDWFSFLIEVLLKWCEWIIFAPKINIFDFFKSFCQVFLKLYLAVGVKKWLQVAIRIFKENLHYTKIVGKVIFGPKKNFFKLFFKSIHKIFLTLYIITGTYYWVKLSLLKFQGIFILFLKWGKLVIYGPEINTFPVSCKSIYQAFLNCI